MRRILQAAAIATLLSGALGGCNSRTSFGEGVATAQPLVQATEPSTVLVAIRYPAKFTPEAASVFDQAYIDNIYGIKCGPFVMFAECHEDRDELWKSVGKTAFYAAELYAFMRDRLPSGTVILEPATVEHSGDRFYYTNVNADLPKILTIDFFAYSSPIRTGPRWYGPPTFGNYFFPLVAGMTDSGLRPATNGLVFISDGLAYTPEPGFEYAAIVNGLARKNEGAVPTASSVSGEKPYGFPTTGSPMISDEDWRAYFSGRNSAAAAEHPKLARAYYEGITNVTLAFLHQAASAPPSAAPASAGYASAVLGTDDVDPALLKAVQSAERTFMVARSEAILNTYEQKFMPAMRAQLLAEVKQLDNIGSQDAKNAFAALGMGLAGGTAGIMGAVSHIDATDRTLKQTYDDQFGYLGATQVETAIAIAGHESHVTASTLQEFRESVRQIVRKRTSR